MKIKEKKIYSLYLADGGSDVLLSGEESELATPVEDMMHLRAVHHIPIENKYVCALGMTCDCASVPKKELLARLEYLDKYLIEKYILTIDDPYVKKYFDVFHKCQPENSIVNSLICTFIY